MAKILDIKNLETNFYTYEGVVKALNRVSFSVDHGSTFGLVGESGCGKSVTVRSIMGIVQEPGKIENGEINFFPDPEDPDSGMELLSKDEAFMESLRGNLISMVFQEPNAALNPIMTIGEQIAESYCVHQRHEMIQSLLLTDPGSDLSCSPDVRVSWFLKPLYRYSLDHPDSLGLKILKKIPLVSRWDRGVMKKAIQKSIELLGILGISNPENIVCQYPNNLSGGMKQRVVIAIALASNPVLLIADEATSNLDVTIQAQILELLDDLKQRQVISSILLITHDLGIVAQTCDRVGVMYAGNICEMGSVDKIFDNPKHPYTKALLESVPRMFQQGDLKTIVGNVPNLVSPPEGCRFHPRCEHAMLICKNLPPQIENIGQDHQVACHLYTSKS
jgi:peptide/nickel transport system ATP-binding protein